VTESCEKAKCLPSTLHSAWELHLAAVDSPIHRAMRCPSRDHDGESALVSKSGFLVATSNSASCEVEAHTGDGT
jgi:hypothetical protein